VATPTKGKLMLTLLKSKTVTARKYHGCDTCDTPIQPGQTYRREAFVDGGTVRDLVQCVPCDDIRLRVWDWVWARGNDGFDRDDYVEWATEYADDVDYGKEARAYRIRCTPRDLCVSPAVSRF
jgi:hypothetical protein